MKMTNQTKDPPKKRLWDEVARLLENPAPPASNNGFVMNGKRIEGMGKLAKQNSFPDPYGSVRASLIKNCPEAEDDEKFIAWYERFKRAVDKGRVQG